MGTERRAGQSKGCGIAGLSPRLGRAQGDGVRVGLSRDLRGAFANGGIPDDLSEHEKIAARVARQLSTRHRIDEELYREAEQAFGRTGLFDIAALMGQYHTVCAALNLFEVPAPN